MIPYVPARAAVWHYAVDDFGVEWGEARPVVLKPEGFGPALEGCGRFDYDEVVYVGGEGVQSDFEPVEFRGEEDEVVDFAGSCCCC